MMQTLRKFAVLLASAAMGASTLGAAEIAGTVPEPNRPVPEGGRIDLKKPVKVFILAGQSNMEGHAKVSTFDYIGDDPATAPLLKDMRNADGTPRVCDHVWISYLTGREDANGEGFGKLTAGYGSRQDPTKDGGKIGPEFTLGLRMDHALRQPVLLIKTAWGGKSLHTDFRPPSAGPYVPTEADLASKRFDTPEKTQKKIDETGRYYRLMIDHARRVLKDIKRVIPDYDPKQGYELGGFVWLQGWNDMVDHGVYPRLRDGNANEYAKYSEWLADFIRDVRKDLEAPNLPFVIGVMGVGGMDHVSQGNLHFREAMAAPAALPEFNGRVVAVPLAPFWEARLGAIDAKRGEVRETQRGLDNKVKAGRMTREEAARQAKEFEEKLITPEEQALWQRGASNAGYHYLGCAKTFALTGRAFADALLRLQGDPR